MINTLSKINLLKIGWEGGGSTSIWIMSLNILGGVLTAPLIFVAKANRMSKCVNDNQFCHLYKTAQVTHVGVTHATRVCK